jgi:membrane protein DedA with SNARE-associated domain
MIASATIWTLIETLGTECTVTATDTPESTWARIGSLVLFGIVAVSLVLRILLDWWNNRN